MQGKGKKWENVTNILENYQWLYTVKLFKGDLTNNNDQKMLLNCPT